MAATRKPKTRKTTMCPVFGTPQELSGIVLPTYESVMKCYMWWKHKLKPTSDTKEPTVMDICERVSLEIEKIWHTASIPVTSHKRVLQLIRAYHDKYRKLMKPYKGRHNDKSYMSKLLCFGEESKENLFDIAACKCMARKCLCKKECKVPCEEQEFLNDQRTTRLMCISTVDKTTTTKLKKRLKRRADEVKRTQKYRKSSASDKSVFVDPSSGDDEGAKDVDDKQSDTVPHGEEMIEAIPPTPKVRVCAPRRDMPALARACDRHMVSDRSAAAIASAVLQDFGLVTADDALKVIDPSKVRRERRKKRKQLQGKQSPKHVCGLYFDGRKDKTMMNIQEGGKYYRRTVTEEHYSLIQEPGSSYLGHVTPNSGTAKEIKTSITAFLSLNIINNIAADELVAVGCDGTNVNTGKVGGVIRLLELDLEKPLQWLVCQLHCNELPLRHLLEHIDGPTSGPRAFSGPIGKALSKCEQLPVSVKFDKIEVNLPEVNLSELSTDQKYLWEITNAVSIGHCPLSLSKKEPGIMNHSRWLTTANRLLRLYIASDDPSDSLKTLAGYVVKVYAQMWFTIKSKPSCKDGSRHLWQTIHLSRYLPNELRKVVDVVLQRNGFFCHPENLLLAMITDEQKHIRELGLRRILKARSQCIAGSSVRIFTIPEINYDAEDYTQLINWKLGHITEPPLTVNISDDVIRAFVASKESPLIEFPRFPCHTQAVERCVKLVTEASASVCGNISRDGFIRARLEARHIMPVFNTKSEYRVK
jgi:hypothetical protein